MVQRNEDKAIIAPGTMLMVRRSAFDAVGCAISLLNLVWVPLIVLIQGIPFLRTTAMSLIEEVRNRRAARALPPEGVTGSSLPAEGSPQ